MEQRIFECYIGGGTTNETRKLKDLMDQGWRILTAIPLVRNGETYQINYIIYKNTIIC